MNNIHNMFRQEGDICYINLLFTAMSASRNVSYESYSCIVALGEVVTEDICVEHDAQLLLSQLLGVAARPISAPDTRCQA
jgi:hypothetical protein